MIASVLIITAFVGGTFYGYWIALHTRKDEPKEEPRQELSNDMARQWANLRTYDGTERGQIEYADDDT